MKAWYFVVECAWFNGFVCCRGGYEQMVYFFDVDVDVDVDCWL